MEEEQKEYNLFDSFVKTLIIILATSIVIIHLFAFLFNVSKELFIGWLFLISLPYFIFPLIYSKNNIKRTTQEEKEKVPFNLFIKSGILIVISFLLTIFIFSIIADILDYKIISIISLFFSLAQLISLPLFTCGFIILIILNNKNF
jgi:hypothetical protein